MRYLGSITFFLFLIFTGLPTWAVTYVMVADEDLADQAPIIAEVRVLSVDRSPSPNRVVTDYLMSVEHVLKGVVDEETVTVRVAGGVGQDGMELHLIGAPRFKEEQRALLFLKQRRDGTYGILHFLLGAFHVVTVGGEDLALRNLSDAAAVTQAGEPDDRPQTLRGLDLFRTWIEQRDQGITASADYFVQPQEVGLSSASDAFTLIRFGGTPTRWAVFDNGGRTNFSLHSSGQPGLPDLGVAAFRAALRAWNEEPNTPIDLRYAGFTTATGGLEEFDSINAILFDDPNDNSIFESPFSCSTGGVIAAASPWTNASSLVVHRGVSFRRINGGDIVTNKGLACWINRNLRAQEVFAHEIGHTLGLSHSCGDDISPSCSSSSVLNQAVMRAQVHGDGRGARLNQDDQEGICFLYADSCDIGGGGGGTVPAAPSDLAAVAESTSTINLTWTDNADNETQFQVERLIGGSFQRIQTLGANVTDFLDSGLDSGTTYTYRVRSRNDVGTSAYTSEVSATTVPDDPPPAAPANLAATTISSTEIRLTWTDNADNETSFRVEREVNGLFREVTGVAANSTSAVVDSLEPYTTHTFRVRAQGDGGNSAFTNSASADTHPSDTSTPAIPSQLLAVPVSPSEVRVVWQDNAGNELGYAVEMGSGGAFQEVGSLPRDSAEFLVGGLTPGVDYQFRARSVGVFDSSEASPAVRASIVPAGSVCIEGAETSCQLGDRFQVEVQWRNQRNGEIGRGMAVPLSDRTGTFWFFNADNTELIAKVLDGQAVNGRFWFFYGALTDLEYWITLSDTVSGQVTAYHNPPGEICGAADTAALLGDGASSSPLVAPNLDSNFLEEQRWSLNQGELLSIPGSSFDSSAQASGESCGGGVEDLCLFGDRFRVEVSWTRRDGQQGIGTAIPSNDRTGYFWFFNEDNIELVVKMLDGRAANGNFWVFYGALSNVRYELTVTDTETGATKTYVNPQGNVCGIADTEAL